MNIQKNFSSQNENIYKVGNCYFKMNPKLLLKGYGQKNFIQFSNRLQKQVLKIRSSIDLISQQQFWKAWQKILQKMILSDMQSLYACHSALNQKILKQISHIEFNYIQVIELDSDHLTSIQTLHMIKAFNLKKLSLKNNRIFRVNTLQKCQFTFLQQINLQDNLFVASQNMRIMHFKSLKSILLKSFNVSQYKYDVSKLVKLQTEQKQINKTLNFNFSYLKQLKVLQMLENKNIK